MNLYSELNVNKDATSEEIKEAYYRAAKENHPDKNGSQEKMQKINHAYAVLRNSASREHYDKTGKDEERDTSNEIIMRFIHDILSQIIITNPENITVCLNKLRGNYESTYNENLLNNKSQIKNLEKIKERIIKAPENDVVSKMLNDRIDGIKRGISGIEKDYNLKMKAIDILEEYEFSVRENQYKIFMQTTTNVESAISEWEKY